MKRRFTATNKDLHVHQARLGTNKDDRKNTSNHFPNVLAACDKLELADIMSQHAMSDPHEWT
jgi:hypothetical protein